MLPVFMALAAIPSVIHSLHGCTTALRISLQTNRASQADVRKGGDGSLKFTYVVATDVGKLSHAQQGVLQQGRERAPLRRKLQNKNYRSVVVDELALTVAEIDALTGAQAMLIGRWIEIAMGSE